ncbi:GAF domain-containing protein [Pendulispora rubella]|uniref:GAF domain-containing protein n=1 Tax=Pendulispora rubella TaxID=2741070 RepID=A0ABZ2KUS5_9BACT
MRFFVHVTPIGKVETQSYCVEADSWQKALQNARALRKEDAPITGFSIELTDDGGCRAVDPAARLRYVVKKAPDTAVLSSEGSISAQAERVSAAPHAGAAGAPRNNGRTQTIGYGTTGIVPVPSTASQPQMRHSESAPKAGLGAGTAPQTVPGATKSAVSGETGNGSEPHVLYRREQEPTDESPLLYREDVYVMPEGTTEAQAEKYLRAQFLTIKAVLASSRPGKYVNLAVFDHAFEGRPTRLPLATLSWKDWKGQEPTIIYPRSAGAVSFAPFSQQPARPAGGGGRVSAPSAPPAHEASAPPAAAAAAQAAPVKSIPPSLAPLLIPHGSESGVLVAPVLNVASTQEASHVGPPPSSHGAAAPPAILAIGEALRRASQPPPAPAAQAGPGAAPTSSPGTQALSGSTPAPAPTFPARGDVPPSSDPGRGSSAGMRIPTPGRPSRPSVSLQRGRVRGDELIAVLFEAMHDLHFSRDTLEASEFCLQLALENIPSRAAFAHFYDIDKREYVIVATVGAGTQQMILRHHPPTDPLLSAAMRKRTAIVIPDAAGSQEAFVERFEQLGGAKSIIVAPVMLGGRALAAIELLNPTDGAPFSEAEGNAMTYMGEQFAEYVSSHGLVLDPERIRQRRR